MDCSMPGFPYWLNTAQIYNINLIKLHIATRASLLTHLVKNPPAVRETWVWSLGWQDPLEKGTATHSSILTWRIPGLYSPWGGKESDMTDFHFEHKFII